MRVIRIISKHFVVLSILFYFIGLAQHLVLAARRSPDGVLDWKLTQYYVNYFDFGFLRRAAVGTLLHPLMASFDAGRFDHIDFVLLIVAVALVMRRDLVVSGAVLAVGILVHEVMFLFGFP